MSFTTLSAILRGEWLLSRQWATAHLPVVAGLMKGEAVDFGNTKLDKKAATLLTYAAASTKIYSVHPRTDLREVEPGSIAVVSLFGPMIKNGDYCAYGMTDQTKLINHLAASTNISAIILDIDSPGGQADGTAMLAAAIKEAGAQKPVIAIVNDGMAASAAMWIASAATEIYCTQATDQFGSIGVYTTIADWAGYYETQGLKITEIYAPQSTDKNRGYYEALAGDDTLIKADLSVLAEQFINTIATNRAGKIKGDTWKTGKMFYAADAKKIGLIDGIKSMNQVYDRALSLTSLNKKSNSNTMAFEKTLVAANATEFAVTDLGFTLSEESLNNIEASLATIETASISASELITANATIAVRDATIATLIADNAIARETSTATADQIKGLQDQITALGKTPSGKGTVITVKEDIVTEQASVPSYLDDSNPANQFADKRIKRHQSKII